MVCMWRVRERGESRRTSRFWLQQPKGWSSHQLTLGKLWVESVQGVRRGRALGVWSLRWLVDIQVGMLKNQLNEHQSEGQQCGPPIRSRQPVCLTEWVHQENEQKKKGGRVSPRHTYFKRSRRNQHMKPTNGIVSNWGELSVLETMWMKGIIVSNAIYGLTKTNTEKWLQKVSQGRS